MVAKPPPASQGHEVVTHSLDQADPNPDFANTDRPGSGAIGLPLMR